MDAPSKSCRNILSEFIATYRDLPQLWNTKCAGYTSRKSREQGYILFLKRFRVTCPTITIKEIKSKINTVRTNFRRELKKVKDSGYTYISSLWYFENLRFLENHLGTTTIAATQQHDIVLKNNGGGGGGGGGFGGVGGGGDSDFNLKIINVGTSSASKPMLGLSDSIITRCHLESPNTTQDVAVAYRQDRKPRPSRINHDPEISSTNKPNHHSSEEKESDDCSFDVPSFLNVKVEIPTTPEPDQPKTLTRRACSESMLQLPDQGTRTETTQQNPLRAQSRSRQRKSARNQQEKQLSKITCDPSQPTVQLRQFDFEPNQRSNSPEIVCEQQPSGGNQVERDTVNGKTKPHSKHKSHKRKRGRHHYEEILNTVRSQFKEKDEQEVDLIAQAWAMKLKRLKLDQRIFAEKFIGDIFMEAELGALRRNSLKINNN